MRAKTFRRIVVALVALHSFALGTAMLFWPTWTLRTFGWPYDGPTFFPSQSGVLLLLLGISYVGGIYHLPFVFFLVVSKACAVAFLVTQYLVNEEQGLILESAAGDAIMGIAVTVALVMEYRARRRVTAQES
ncbi:MAG: hypothetical protein QGG42_15120 [Phycisphaerae bacterium]|jgi:hypothetical protein|nr:hypothetical protein [Phycisphaerae bacterium]